MSKRFITAVICFIGIWMHFTFITGVVSGPTFLRIFNLSKTQLGLILGAGSIGVMVAASMAGHFVSKLGARVLRYGLGLVIISVLLVLFSVRFQMLVVCFAMIGIANALMLNANTTILSDLFPGSIRRIIALYSALYFGSSAMLAPFLGKWLDAARNRNWDFWGFRLPYIIILLVFILLFALVNKIVLPAIAAREKAASPGRDKKKTRDVPPLSLSLKKFWWVPVMAFLHNIMVTSVLTWSNPMAQEKFGADEFHGALFIVMITSGIAAGRFLMAFIHLKWEDRTVLAFGVIAGGILTIAGLFSSSYVLALLLISSGSFISSVSYPCIASIAGNFHAGARAKVFGYMFTGFALAGFVGPPMIGKLADSGIPVWLALAIGPASGFSLGFLSILWKKKRRKKMG